MRIIDLMVVMSVVCIVAQPIQAGNDTRVWRTETAEAFEQHVRDRFVVVQQEPPGIRLCRSWLLATEKGVNVKQSVGLSETVWARKKFDMPLPQSQAADLYIYRGGGTPAAPMRIEINGKVIEHTSADDSIARGWRRQVIPGGWFRAGRNEIVLSGNGRIVADTGSPVTGSEVSYDGGLNWHTAEGEFIVRLRLHDYPSSGEIISKVIDTARVLAPDRSIGPWPSPPAAARITVDADQPRGTSIEVSWRAGSSPRFDPRTWSVWQTGVKIDRVPGRYFQWRIQPITRNADRTPLVRSIRISFTPSEIPELPAWTDRLEPLSFDHAPALESAYPFTYETDAPRVRYLRERERLDTLRQPEHDDLAHTSAVRDWTSRRWKNGWNSGRYRYVPPWDAHILLDMAPDNLCLGMCTHYATVYVQASVALGYLTRHVIVDSHCVAETFLDDRAQWIIQDTGPGAGPDGYPVPKRFERDGRTLNALELHRILDDERFASVLAVPNPEAGDEPWHDEPGILQFRRFAIALRNDHLSNPEPAESEHGSAHYRYDGYLWWSDNPENPAGNIAMYSLLSNREADFYPDVNTTRIELEAMEDPALQINLQTLAPNFKTFEINIDGAGWQPVSTPIRWPLNQGENLLEARSLNAFGRSGPVASALVVLE